LRPRRPVRDDFADPLRKSRRVGTHHAQKIVFPRDGAGEGVFSWISGHMIAPGARAMLATAALWSIGANIDRMGVLASTPLLWITGVTDAIALFALCYRLSRPHRPAGLRALQPAFLAGAAMSVGNTAQMWALTILFAPYVIAIKRLSALFTVLASGRLLKEDVGGRLPGAALMLAGAVIIALARR
jgi:drug/metabolite transporter (DMT)-like permease